MSGPPDKALADARRLLGDEPGLAEVQPAAVLRAAPGHPEALLIQGAARRRVGDLDGARQVLVALAAVQPKAWGVHLEAGAALAALGETRPAIDAFSRAAELNPGSSLAWHALGDQLAIAGDQAGAESAQARPLPGSLGDPRLMEAASAVLAGRTDQAAELLRGFNMYLNDLLTARLLADAGARMGRHKQVEAFLAPYLDAAPLFLPARHAYAVVLYRQSKHPEAMIQVERLLGQEPRSPAFLTLHAALQVQVGNYEAATTAYLDVLNDHPGRADAWLAYGHVLKTMGRQDASVAAYRRSLALQPSLGEAYWSLANLKVVRFADSDIAAMNDLLSRGQPRPDDRAHLHFALAKALEDEARYAESFEHYRQGNALRRAAAPYDADANHDYVRRVVQTFTPEFFAARASMGAQAPDPIFVIGLPRSGSTLIEQMLASHSAVEGTAELPDLTALAARVASAAEGASRYPASLCDVDPSAFAALGEEYLARTRLYRKSDRPRFVDKFPNNFMHVGLIHLIAPNARIVDVRRDPMACCLSAFKLCFAQGQHYSYDLADLGRYYVDYVQLMAHFDRVLPGRVHRVSYENLVADPEAELRRLLDYCGLDFEASCLRFHESDRPVRTASSEQVRRPIFSHGVDHWRHFEPWLGPLKSALGRA